MLGNALIQAENLGQLLIRIDQAFIECSGQTFSWMGFSLACFVHSELQKLTGILWTAGLMQALLNQCIIGENYYCEVLIVIFNIF